MMEVVANPVSLISLRCQNTVTSKRDGKKYRCNKKLMEIEEGTVEAICPKCKNLNRFEVRRAHGSLIKQ